MVPMGWSLGQSASGSLRILDDLADLASHEVGGRIIGGFVGEKVGVRIEEADRPSFLPLALIGGVTLLFRHLECRLRRRRIARDRERRIDGIGAAPRILGLVLGLLLGLHWSVLRRQREVGSALEHEELPRLLGDMRDRLHARRACADHADPEAGEIDTLMRPQAGVVGFALEAVDALDIELSRRREIARGHDQVGRGDGVALVGLHCPAVRRRIEHRGGRDRVELDVPSHVEPIGHMLHVGEDLALVAVALGPLPLLVEFGREGERVLKALNVATASRVTVPKPGPANVGTPFEGARSEAELSQFVNRIDATHARANDDGVEVIGAGLDHQSLLEQGNRQPGDFAWRAKSGNVCEPDGTRTSGA